MSFFTDVTLHFYLILQGESSSVREEKRLLSVKVKLDEGGYGYVFSIKTTDLSVRWKCHLCDVLIIGQKHVDTHIQSKKHQVKMALPSHPASLFTRLDTKPLGKSLFCVHHVKSVSFYSKALGFHRAVPADSVQVFVVSFLS
jgi:hypothetical protein